MRHLLPIFKNPSILLPWWDKLTDPVLDSVGKYKGVATEAINNLLALTNLDSESTGSTDTGLNPFADRLLRRWMELYQAAKIGNETAEFKISMISEGLMSYGKKDPKVSFLQPV